MNLENQEQWQAELKDIFQSNLASIEADLQKAKNKVEAVKQDPFLRRKSTRVNFLQKVAITAVSLVFVIEKTVRRIFGNSLASKFLVAFQKIMAQAEKVIDEDTGQIPIPKPLPMKEADGTGGLTVAMLLSSIEREKAAALLPEGLELLPDNEFGKELRSQVPAGHHPIMIALGFNSDVGPVWKNNLFVKMNYLELTFGVPAVRLRPEYNDPKPFFYIPALLLNAFTPTLLGWLFGFKKRLKRIQANEFSYRVFPLLSNQPLLSADIIVNSKDRLTIAPYIDGLSPWLEFLDVPIVSKTSWSRWKFTFFHWDWLFTLAAPAEVRVETFTDELPLLPKGPSIFGSLAQDAAPPAGERANSLRKAYVMMVPWRLLVPFSHKAIRNRPRLFKLFGRPR